MLILLIKLYFKYIIGCFIIKKVCISTSILIIVLSSIKKIKCLKFMRDQACVRDVSPITFEDTVKRVCPPHTNEKNL